MFTNVYTFPISVAPPSSWDMYQGDGTDTM